MYPDATYQTPRSPRKKFLIVFGALCGLALLVVIVLGATHKVQQHTVASNLSQFDGPLFSTKYPKDFAFSFISGTETKFYNNSSKDEYFTVDFSPAGSAPVNPQTLLFYKDQAEKKDKAKTSDFKVNGTDASSIATTDSSTGITTEKVYLFKSDYVWSFVFVYKDGSVLAKSKTAILDSFKPTLAADPTPAATSTNQPTSTGDQSQSNTETQ